MKRSKGSPEEALSGERAADANTIAKGGAIQIVGQIVNRALTFVFVAVALRVLTADGYGLYRQVFQVLTIGTMIASGGFPQAALRFIAQARTLEDHSGSRGAARVTLLGTAIVGVVVLAVLVVAPDWIASFFADSPSAEEQFSDLLVIGALYIPLYGLMQVLRSCTQAYKTMIPSVMVGNIIQPISRLALGIVALLAGFALTGAVVTLVVSAALGVSAGVWYYQRTITADERSAKPRGDAGRIVRFTIPQTGNSLFSTGSLGLGVVILGLLSDDRSVGLFAVATSLQTAGNVFANGIVAIWAPVVVDLFERGAIDRLESLYQAISRWLATLSFPVFALLILEPDLFARILAGSEGRGAVALIPILAVGNMVRVGTGPAGYLLSMTGRPTINFFNSVLGVGLYIGLGLWLVPIHGVLGMAVVDSFVTALVNTARVVEGRILVGVRPFGRSYLKPLAALLIASVPSLLLKVAAAESTLNEVLGLVMFGVLYVVILKFMGLDPEERLVIDTVKRRVLKRLGRKS